MENWVERVETWICGKIWKKRSYSLSFVHLPYLAIFSWLNKMKSIARVTVKRGKNLHIKRLHEDNMQIEEGLCHSV